MLEGVKLETQLYGNAGQSLAESFVKASSSFDKLRQTLEVSEREINRKPIACNVLLKNLLYLCTAMYMYVAVGMNTE